MRDWGRLAWVTAAVLVLWVAMLGYLGVISEQALPPPAISWLIKHRFGALIITALLHLLLVPLRPRWPRWLTAGVSWVAVVTGGVLLEVAQLFVPNRGQEIDDLIENAIGATLGAAISTALIVFVTNRRVLVTGTTVFAAVTLLVAGFAAVRYQPEPPSSCPSEGDLFRPVGEPLAVYHFGDSGDSGDSGPSEDRVVANLAQETDSELELDGGEFSVNGGIIRSSAGWEFTGGTGIARSPSSAGWLLCNIIPAEVVVLEAWYTPENLDQIGPTRIVAFSEGTNPWEANIHLGHEGTQASLRIRTRPEKQHTELVDDVFTEAGRPYHLVMWFADGVLHLSVDGQEVFAKDIGRDIQWWSDFYPLNVGNEVSRDRGLEGTLHGLSIHNTKPTPEIIAEWFANPPPGVGR